IFIRDLKISEWQLFDYRGQKYAEQLLQSVPDGKWIFFDEEIYRKFRQHLRAEDETVLIDSPEEGKQMDVNEQNIVLPDLPPSLKHLENLFSGKAPARIYA